ncbi:MAG: hypothetical protein Q9198_009367, partial [Flavoplaca austrocitrina]
QYQLKRGDNKAPWILKHDGRPVSLESTIGEVNTFGNNVVALEAVDTPSATPSRSTSSAPGNPLSPKDPNPRVWHAPLAPKSTPFGKDENSRPASTTPVDTITQRTTGTSRQDPTARLVITYTTTL